MCNFKYHNLICQHIIAEHLSKEGPLQQGPPLLQVHWIFWFLDAQVVCHPFIVGELACGNIKNRVEFLSLLQSLPMAPTVSLDELLYFIDRHALMGMGIGFVDAHLLASAQLSSTPLWTSDKKLKSAATKLEVSYK